MNESKKDRGEELNKIVKTDSQLCANTTPQTRCYSQSVKSKNVTSPTGYPAIIDTAPGTSRSCNCCSILKPKEAAETTKGASTQSIASLVCRICHNNENPQELISPCLCKGSLAYVHRGCLQRWISMSRCTTCELCQFQYNTEQTLRYTFHQSLRLWYSRSMSRRALQEDCQMFLLLSLIAFGIVGTLLVAVQYYILKTRIGGTGRTWTKGWLIFFLLSTLAVYLINVYMIIKSHLMPWYRWWQSARDIRLILETRNQLKIAENSNWPVAQVDVSTSETANECCRQQTVRTQEKEGDVLQDQQYMCQARDATYLNLAKSMNIFHIRNKDNYEEQLANMKGKTMEGLQTLIPAAENMNANFKEPFKTYCVRFTETV